MARYLFSVHIDDDRPAMTPERQRQAHEETGDFNEWLRERGALVYANGLATEAYVVDQGHISEGFYIQGPRRLGGFWIIDAPDEATARSWATEAARACNEPVEVRAFH